MNSHQVLCKENMRRSVIIIILKFPWSHSTSPRANWSRYFLSKANIALLVCVFVDQTNSFFVALLVQYLRKSAYQPYAIVVVLTGCYLAETVEGAWRRRQVLSPWKSPPGRSTRILDLYWTYVMHHKESKGFQAPLLDETGALDLHANQRICTNRQFSKYYWHSFYSTVVSLLSMY